MKVILLKELKGKGGEGDVVEVAPGFANNYLFPQKIAVRATEGNLKQLDQRRNNIAKREETRLSDAEALQKRLAGLTLQIDARVGEEGVLFGSVTTQMIADALAAEGIDVDKRHIDLKHAIKKAGEHEAVVSIYREIKSPVKLMVGSKEAIEAAAAAEAEAAAENAEEAVVEAEVAAEVAADATEEAVEAAVDQAEVAAESGDAVEVEVETVEVETAE